MSDVKLVIAYTTFLVWMTFMVSLGSPVILQSEGMGNIKPPSCQIGGWTTIIDIISCGAGRIGFFFKMMSISSTYQVFGTVIMTPMLVGFLYVMLKWLRGN